MNNNDKYFHKYRVLNHVSEKYKKKQTKKTVIIRDQIAFGLSYYTIIT